MASEKHGQCALLWDNLHHVFFHSKINVGCSTDSSSADPVRLEFSRDFGATWHLLLPLCYHSSSLVSSLCSTEHHPSSTYYAGTTQGWRREVVHFGKLHLCGWGPATWHHACLSFGDLPFWSHSGRKYHVVFVFSSNLKQISRWSKKGKKREYSYLNRVWG